MRSAAPGAVVDAKPAELAAPCNRVQTHRVLGFSRALRALAGVWLGLRAVGRLGLRGLRPLGHTGSRLGAGLVRRGRGRPLSAVLFAAATVVVSINGAVRITGGDPPLWALSHLGDKVLALGRLALHAPFHAFGACGRSPEELLRSTDLKGVSPGLVRAVARTESNWRPHVISHAGAMGVMQLMPSTAVRMGVWDPFDPQESLRGGARYLSELRQRYRGNLRRTVAAYHAGPNAVAVRGPLKLGPKTERYVKVVTRRVAPTTTSSPRRRDGRRSGPRPRPRPAMPGVEHRRAPRR